jgi:hypothetical protein
MIGGQSDVGFAVVSVFHARPGDLHELRRIKIVVTGTVDLAAGDTTVGSRPSCGRRSYKTIDRQKAASHGAL